MIIHDTQGKHHVSFDNRELGLPLYMESIGFNPEQEAVRRPAGYTHWHWLQTEDGEGDISVGGQRFALGPGQGFLLQPGLTHEYRRSGPRWSTRYVTFAGSLSDELLGRLGLGFTAVYSWDRGSAFDKLLEAMLARVDEHDISGLRHSAEVYTFLVELKAHSRLDNKPSIHSVMGRIAPLIRHLEEHFSDPSLDAAEMAAVLNVSPRRMTSLFRQASGFTPHQYLRGLRIRKAKTLLGAAPAIPVKRIALLSGFKDASHFVHSFRQLEGISPERFRRAGIRENPG